MAVEKLVPDAGSVIELGGQDAKIIIFKVNEETGEKQAQTSIRMYEPAHIGVYRGVDPLKNSARRQGQSWWRTKNVMLSKKIQLLEKQRERLLPSHHEDLENIDVELHRLRQATA